ncbi:MAG TPA: hypothetical protein VN031_03100 [Candidatus Microsaccharimonas sp.]|nr:hypothetical protein [Candidatus Microsaccharimonas sp.]
MGEDFPLDPNQVQPPQEAQPEELQQAGAPQVENMPQEGDTVAAEVVTPEGEQLQGAEAVSSDAHVDDEGVPASYIRNEEKAATMADKQNETFDDNDGKTIEEWRAEQFSPDHKPSWSSPEAAAKDAGKDYDLVKASKLETPERAREFALKSRSIFLDYSHAIAENYREHGDQLSPSLQALDLVYELAKDVGYHDFNTVRANYDQNGLKVELDTSDGGAVVVTTKRFSGQPREEWRLPMFSSGAYTLTERAADPNGEFSSVVTTKTRSLTEEDVTRLGTLLEPAVKHKAQEKKWQEQAYHEDEDEQDDLRREVAFQKHLDETGDWSEAQRRAGVTPK